jgi:4-amino-4-deoxy-L-arabinose transferase-like glycosyltransferase
MTSEAPDPRTSARSGKVDDAPQPRDFLWIAAFLALLIVSGYGLRDPWPADEPRFAGLARDMVQTGRWLIPFVGGDLYADKPPLFFWLLALAYSAFGSVRATFLLPSLLAAAGTLLLVYDLGRRLFGRDSGLLAALLLACTVQFVIATRGAQIDPTLLLCTTLSLYGFCRHLLLGPGLRWLALGGFAAGLGVITKGVGFLPMLALPIAAVLARFGFEPLALPALRRAWLALITFTVAIAIWGLPMLFAVASSDDPGLVAYRNEIFLQQTVTRYAQSWHHQKPWYYFLVEVVPVLWLPASALLFWLAPRWRADWRARDARVGILLTWVVCVIAFFSVTAGKRGIYILPALPALVLAAAPHLPALLRQRGVARAGLALAALLVLGGLATLIARLVGEPRLASELAASGVTDFWPLYVFAFGSLLLWGIAAWRAPIAAWPAVLATLTICWGLGVAPQINGERSARTFMARVLAAVPRDATLGLVGYKEQFLLYMDRPTVNFGHARWREAAREQDDAARWLAESPRHLLLVPEQYLSPCFDVAPRRFAGLSSDDRWYLVSGQPRPQCAMRGDAARRIEYPAHPIG